MDQFRLILILIGIALLLLVYVVSRRASSRQRNQPEKPSVVQNTAQKKQRIPMSGDVAPPERPYQAAMEQAVSPHRKSRKRYVKFLGNPNSNRTNSPSYSQFESQLEPLTVVVYVMPLAGISFRREQVLRCLESMGCVPRSDAGFDYAILDKSGSKMMHPLFMITDAHKPGIFSPEPEAADKTNGLVFEMRLPGPIDSVAAFEKLLDIARLVATKLNGVVCDDLQNRLTKQATSHIKDKILDHNRKMRFAQQSSIQ